MAKKNDVITSEKLKISGRAAFLRIDKPKAFEEGQTPRYEGTCLVDPSSPKGKEALKALLTEAARISKLKWGFVAKAIHQKAVDLGFQKALPAGVKEDGVKFDALYDGNTKEYDGYAGNWVLAMHNTNRPGIANRKGDPLEDPNDEQWPYSGCNARFSYTMWTQDNKFGKRIGFNLRGVQFVSDNTAFGAGSINAKDEFDALDEADAPTGEEDAPFGSD
jgi:hypothetical protein